MKNLHRVLAALVLVGACAGAGAAVTATSDDAGERCEAAVADTVRRVRGPLAKEVEFVAAARRLVPTDGSDETRVNGDGRYRGANHPTVTFSYSCAYDRATGRTSGVVFRDKPPPADTGSWQPDLANFSPDACEAATAAALKDKHPRVANIAFDAGTRQLQPASEGLTRLEGRGAMARAPGMSAQPFSFRCDFETANGKVRDVQTRE